MITYAETERLGNATSGLWEVYRILVELATNCESVGLNKMCKVLRENADEIARAIRNVKVVLGEMED